ncbi:MAG: hypothetical protein CMM60_14555 [Rhodospirillaceae bacterium]|jgi:uncharacterized protein (DUF488 family)|nr:hypothetical protein [Rhodospirillaceae bacterium]|tara:strand:- start:1398 stop:2066 length:669 start_codon:yes stop_codon:yes gene_type:complete
MNGSSETPSRTPPLVAYTVGHSNHTLEHFIEILIENDVTAIADVRSVPYSRYTTQFDREALHAELKAAGIAYSFLGKELGARPDDADCYKDGMADYNLIAATPLFQSGLDRVIEGAQKYKIALMCAEKDPLDCHRTILVGRSLKRRNVVIRHIHADGKIEDCETAEKRLVKLTKQEMDDMFQPPGTVADPVERAYTVRGREIAYTESHDPVSQADEQLADSL